MDVFIIIVILSIIIYAIFYNYLKKRIKNKNYRILVCISLSCFIGIILYTVLVGAFIYALTKEKHREFERERWILVGEDINKRLSRFEMIDDLIDSKFLIKKDSLQVRQILGEPDWRDEKNYKWTYEAGTGGGIGFVDHYLDIYYDAGYETVKVEHRRIKD